MRHSFSSGETKTWRYTSQQSHRHCPHRALGRLGTGSHLPLSQFLLMESNPSTPPLFLQDVSDLSIVERRRAEINSRPAINSHSTQRAQIMNKDETKSPRKPGPLTRTMRKPKPFLQPRLRKNIFYFQA